MAGKIRKLPRPSQEYIDDALKRAKLSKNGIHGIEKMITKSNVKGTKSKRR